MVTGSADTWNRGIFLALKRIMHLIAAVHYAYGLYFDFRFVYPPVGHPAYAAVYGFGGKFRYLTILGAVCIIQSVQFVSRKIDSIWQIRIVCHILHWKSRVFFCILNKFIDFFFHRFAKPSTFRCVFWMISLELMKTTQNGRHRFANLKIICLLHSLFHWRWMLPSHFGPFMPLTVNWFYRNHSNHSSQSEYKICEKKYYERFRDWIWRTVSWLIFYLRNDVVLQIHDI